jgi:hypothetical protein
VVYTPNYSRVSDVGTVVAGATEIAIANVGVANGIVLGVTLAPGETVSFQAPSRSSAEVFTLSGISYTATGTVFAIVTVTEV